MAKRNRLRAQLVSARFITFLLGLVVLSIVSFAVWMKAGADSTDLSAEEIEAARASGSGARAIELDSGGDSRPLPDLAELREMVDRAAMGAEILRVEAALAEAALADATEEAAIAHSCWSAAPPIGPGVPPTDEPPTAAEANATMPSWSGFPPASGPVRPPLPLVAAPSACTSAAASPRRRAGRPAR